MTYFICVNPPDNSSMKNTFDLEKLIFIHSDYKTNNNSEVHTIISTYSNFEIDLTNDTEVSAASNTTRLKSQ